MDPASTLINNNIIWKNIPTALHGMDFTLVSDHEENDYLFRNIDNN